MATQPRVALVGLPANGNFGGIPEEKRLQMIAQLDAVGQQMTSAGYSYEFIGVMPDDSLEQLTATFKSRQLDCIVVGFGVRGFPQFTPLFERVIEAVRQAAPSTRLMFNTAPSNTLDAAERWLRPAS